MEDRRNFKRFPIKLSAKYLENRRNEWKDCSIIDIGSGGVRIKVSPHEKPHLNSTLQLEIIIPAKENPIKATGTLVWLKEISEKTSFEGAASLNETVVGGVKLVTIENEDKRTLLDYAYGNWSSNEGN